MKPEHERVIEAMANGLYMWRTGAPPKEFGRLRKSLREGYANMATAALRAAAERGYVLAKLPEPKRFMGYSVRTHDPFRNGWNACLDAIETITLEESE